MGWVGASRWHSHATLSPYRLAACPPVRPTLANVVTMLHSAEQNTHFITVGDDVTFELRLLDSERLVVASSPGDQIAVRKLVTDGLAAIRRQFAAPELSADPLDFSSTEGVLL